LCWQYFGLLEVWDFFIGYSVHLICDSFTKEGIQPFWPFKGRSKGFITTGGRVEDSLFVGLVLLDVLLVILVLVFLVIRLF